MPFYAAFVFPAFFLFVGLEYFISLKKRKEKNVFRFDSSVANISIGVAERLLNLFISASFYGLFYFIYERFGLFHIPNHWTVWILLILVTDLVWYWYHRLGHEINFLWAAHIVHHQSDEFNYTVSARITTFQALARNIFWCILPLIGFHPAMVITMLVVHGAYSFFTHTEIIGKLGWLENIFITPSHHRVHHASNEKYLNKNYGDLFVFWDKLFGTFQEEKEKPVYGLTHPLKSYSFMWQHFHYYAEMIEACKRTQGFYNRVCILFGKPEQLDQDIRKQLEKKYLPHQNKVSTNYRFRIYVCAQLVISIVWTFLITLLFQQLTYADKIFGSVIILITLVNCGALLEQRRWICYLEYIRLLLLCSFFSYYVDSLEFFVVSVIFLLIITASFPLHKWYLRFIYDAG